MRFGSRFLLGLLLLVFDTALRGQSNRLELGLRVRALEHQLESCTSPADRVRVAPHLEAAVQRFFSGNEAGVAEALAEASASLLGIQLGANERFAASLSFHLDAKLVDVDSPSLTGSMRQFFPCSTAGVGELTLRLRWLKSDAAATTLPVQSLPMRVELALAAPGHGEQVLEWQVCDGDVALVTRHLRVSLVDSPSERIAALTMRRAESACPGTVEHETLDLLIEMVRSLGPDGQPETELPGLKLLEEAEAIAEALRAKRPASCLTEPGEHWIRIPMGKRSATVRLGLPQRKEAEELHPLVILLHGAGGSENMFFDLYGEGSVVRSCLDRGWIVVAPRSGFLAKPPLDALVDSLAERWPVDPRRVAVVGHSMGGMQALAAVQSHPERYVGVGILGAGGSPRRGTKLEVPFFVGIGERDFAHSGALGLARKLSAAGAPVTLVEYPGVEHLAIVQFARVDLLQFLDTVLAKR